MVTAVIIDDRLSSDDDRVEEPRRAIAPNLSGKTNCKGEKKGIEAAASSDKRLSALDQNGYGVTG